MTDKGKTEQVLWNYRLNVKRAAEMRLIYSLLQSVRGQDYGAHTVNGVSNPVLEVVHRKLAIEKKIKSLEKDIQVVDGVKDSLDVTELTDWQMLGILEQRYMAHKEPDTVMRELGITKATYYRRNNELISRTELYIT